MFDFSSTSLAQVIALKRADLPLLRSFNLARSYDDLPYRFSQFLMAPNLNKLILSGGNFSIDHHLVNWANLRTLTLRIDWDPSRTLSYIYQILKSVKYLIILEISIGLVNETYLIWKSEESRRKAPLTTPYLMHLFWTTSSSVYAPNWKVSF